VTHMKLFCECIKDATARSTHVVTALGNERGRKQRAANATMAELSETESAKKPDVSLDDEDDDIVHGLNRKSWKLPLTIKKADPDKQQIFGWASVVEKDGRAVIDKQGDIIPVEELENAAYEFTLTSRKHGNMHAGDVNACLIESMVFTEEKQKALGIDLGQVGWWVGFKVDDTELWAAHKRGDRPEFSIGGAAITQKVDDGVFKGGSRRLPRFPFRY
jgi:Putative phage serine protease XkdF